MATAKQVVKPQEAISPAAPRPAQEAPKPVEQPVKRWRFVKLHGVVQEIQLRDGSKFKFRLIQLNDGSGYSSTSEVTTSDEKLASNLRDAAKNPHLGIVEVKI
jgi:hypothetical protein